jgi:hypothetical protein
VQALSTAAPTPVDITQFKFMPDEAGKLMTY